MLWVDGATRGRMLVNWGIAEGEEFNLPWSQMLKRKMGRKLSYKSVRLVFVVYGMEKFRNGMLNMY